MTHGIKKKKEREAICRIWRIHTYMCRVKLVDFRIIRQSLVVILDCEFSVDLLSSEHYYFYFQDFTHIT